MPPAAPPPRYWFPAKRYGWGWGFPHAWQGWVVIALYVALIAAGGAFVSPSRQPGLYAAWLVGLTVVLIGVCWAKGEPPRWRWGERDAPKGSERR
jgi:hypothetical protein